MRTNVLPDRKPLALVRDLIENLDLGPIKVKLMDPEEGEGWTEEQVQQAEVAYKRFLYLVYKYSQRAIVPSHVMDAVWHKHILDTYKYVEDCERVFGYFLHHFPYFGMRGDQDADNLATSFDETKELYELEFGESMDSLDSFGASKCDSCGPGSCGHPDPWCSKCNGVTDEHEEEATVLRIESHLRPVFPSAPLRAFA